ncbi:MAG: peptidylprolyl isomerase [Pseudomonadota bacterium]
MHALKRECRKSRQRDKQRAFFFRGGKKYSESPEAENGGVVGLITKGQGIEAFDRAFDMKQSDITGIIQSNYGFHIFNVLGYTPAAEITYKDAKDFIAGELAREKETKYYEEWLKDKLKNIKILKNAALIDSVK